MKKIVIFCLLLLNISLVARSNYISVFEDDKTDYIQELKLEKEIYAEIKAELAYYRNILEKQSIVKKLFLQGENQKIKRLIRKDAKRLDRLSEMKQFTSYKMKINEQRIIFSDIPVLSDYLIYYNARKANINGDHGLAISLFEDLVNNYPQSDKLDLGIKLLEQEYFIEGMDQELVILADRFENTHSFQQNFWLGHSLFNLGRYEESRAVFEVLKQVPEYANKADMMLALLKTFTKDIKTAIQEFLNLKDKYTPENENYDFIIISLARLYAAEQMNEDAIIYYSQYTKMHSQNLSDRIIYEFASVLYNASKYEDAIFLLDKIINRELKTEYFVSAKYLKAISLQGKGDVEKAEANLTAMVKQNDILLETLNTKYRLLKKYHESRLRSANLDISDSEKQRIEKHTIDLENALAKTNMTLQDLYTGLNPGSLKMLRILEEEYFWYSSIISYMKAIIKLADIRPNKKIPEILDDEIARVDSSGISLNIINYLGHLDKITQEDYIVARTLAEEKFNCNKLLVTWHEIEETAMMNNNTDILPYTKKTIRILNDNLESIELVANYFTKRKMDKDLKKLINEEISAIDKRKRQLVALKKEVIEKFNKMIAQRLSNKKEYLSAEFESLNLLYDKTLSMIISAIRKENENYQYNLLGILFRETQILDEEYKQYRDNLKNE